MGAREHYKASHLPEVSTASATEWQEVVSLSFSPVEGADYIVFWSVELINKSHIAYDAKCRVRTDAEISVEFNRESRGTDEYPSFSGFYRLTGADVGKLVAMEIQSEWAGSTIFAQNAHLVALRLGPGDRYAEALDRAAITGGTNSWTDVAALEWTADAGDYLIFGHSLTDNYATTAPVYARLVFDGDGDYEATSGHPEVVGPPKNRTPTHQLWKRTVAVGGISRMAAWQGRSHSTGNEVGFSDNRLLVLRLSDFDAAYYGELTTLLVVTGADTGTLVSVAGAVGAGPHLVLGSWGASGSSASSLLDTRLVDDGVQVARSFQKSMAGASNRGRTSGHVSVGEYAAGPRAWSVDLVGDGVRISYGRPGSALALLGLGTQGKVLKAQSSEFGEGGAAITFRAGRRSTAGAGGVVLAGLAGVLALGRRVRTQTEPVQLGAQIAGLLARRRLDVNLGAIVPAALTGGLRRRRSVAAGMATAAFAGAAVGWRRTYVIHARLNLASCAAAPCALRYSGQRFWSVTPSLNDAWIGEGVKPEAWIPAPSMPENWS